LHAVSPLEQEHAPLTHGSPDPHALPQLPQSSGLVSSETHPPLQSDVDAGQLHAPFWQL
jgi:hypothetical protein